MKDLNPKVTWPIFILFAIVVLGVSGYYSYKYVKDTNKDNTDISTSVTPTATSSTSATPSTPQASIIQVNDAGVTWLSEPKKLEDLKLLKNESDYAGPITQISYYKIADLEKGGEIILAIAQFDVPSGPEIFRFKKNADGKYYYLINHSNITDYQGVEKLIATGVLIDQTSKYQTLSAPDFLKAGTVTMKKASYQPGLLFSSLENPKKLADTDYGSLYQTKTKQSDPDLGSITFYIKLVDSTLVSYSLKTEFITDDEVALVTWLDGTKNSAKYTGEGYQGCGSMVNLNIIFDTNNITSRLTEAGSTNTGDKIYFVQENDPVMKSAYENYKIGREKDILTINEFAKKKPVFVWKDGFGDYVIFTGRDFAGLAECGKPVIYLYPEKKEEISVKVGAEIKKSEPLYNNGWTVIAEPSGKLTLDGAIYDSLYWEGKGQIYPEINSGFIVKKENIESTLWSHLSQLGLNKKESADFMDFWLPKMPTTPYTRFTWFGTAEMNRLAPLSVTPRPDTTIRIFLDFEGLSSPIDIKPQTLSSISRKGFTLVEWGGLLKEEIK